MNLLKLCFVAALLVFLAESSVAQTFSKPFRKTTAGFTQTEGQRHLDDLAAPDPDFEDSDTEASKEFGQWRSDLEFNNPEDFLANPVDIWTLASQDSDIDADNQSFWYYGYTLASIYVQGSASSKTHNLFRFDFQLEKDGRLALDGVIGVSNFFGFDRARDFSGQALIQVKVLDLDAKKVVYKKSIKMVEQKPVRFVNEIDLGKKDIELSAGKYRLVIVAASEDYAAEDEIEFSLAVAYAELEGWIEQD